MGLLRLNNNTLKLNNNLVGFTGTVPAFQISGLTNYWSFEDVTNRVSSGATLYPVPEPATFGAAKYNNGFLFNGTSISAGNYLRSVDVLSLGSVGTISFWLLIPNLTQSPQIIDGADLNKGINMQIANSKIYWHVNGTNEATSWCIDTDNYPLNVWNMVTITWNTTNRKLYVNDALKRNINLSRGAVENTQLLIGSARYDLPNPSYPFIAGSMVDEFSIYNRELVIGEISNLYNSGTGLFY